jgi:hypothetical protein
MTIIPAFRFFDVFLTPSLSEVQPLVVLEALVSGVPVVATDVTPFYAELRKEMPALEPSSMQIAPLDKRFSQGATARESTLTDFEVTSLSQDLIDKIKNVGIYGYKEREQLYTQMILVGFTKEVQRRPDLRPLPLEGREPGLDRVLVLGADEDAPIANGSLPCLACAAGRSGCRVPVSSK